jgi:hypothetical protein
MLRTGILNPAINSLISRVEEFLAAKRVPHNIDCPKLDKTQLSAVKATCQCHCFSTSGQYGQCGWYQWQICHREQ